MRISAVEKLKAVLQLNIKSTFLRNVLILMSGTALAQVISVAVAPLLSRLYEPSAFGVFGVYASIVGIMGAVATLRYDQAIMLPKCQKDAANLFAISLLAVVGVTILSAIVCVLFGTQIVILMKSPDLAGWLWLLPFSVFALGFNQTLNSWCTRQKKFRRASLSQVTRSVSMVITQLTGGVKNVGALGLIGGAVVGDMCANATLARQVYKEDCKNIAESLEFNKIKCLAARYIDFPVYSSTQNLLNAVSQNIPVLLMSYYFSTAVVGYYAIGVRLLQLPMNLVLTSLRQVFFQKASEVYNNDGNTFELFKKVTARLALIAVVPSLGLFFFAPQLFSLVLGNQWITAGEYARWLVLWMSVGFVNMPSIIMAQITSNQKLLFYWDFSMMISRIIVLVIGGIFFTSIGTVISYSMVGFIFNTLIILIMTYKIKSVQRFNNDYI